MQTLKDLNDRDIHLTDERLAHILEHPEMVGQDTRIAETLYAPDSIIASHHDATVLLYHKLYPVTPVTRKHLVVMVKLADPDAFIVTALFTDKEKNIDMDSMNIWYDKEGDFLEITFRQAKGYLKEISKDIYERVDEHGKLLGYAILNVSQHERHALTIPLQLRQLA